MNRNVNNIFIQITPICCFIFWTFTQKFLFPISVVQILRKPPAAPALLVCARQLDGPGNTAAEAPAAPFAQLAFLNLPGYALKLLIGHLSAPAIQQALLNCS